MAAAYRARCALTDEPNGRRVRVLANFFRKPGQSGVNPQLPTELTQGQFESSARIVSGTGFLFSMV